jgi:hypothetical protein
MVKFNDKLDSILSDYVARGVPTDSPGFYDHPGFTAAEELDSEYLSTYARFVAERYYDDAYLARARSEIPLIASVIYEALVKDGRLGACIDVSRVLMRVLEAEGFWNFCVSGSLTLQFPPEAGVPTQYYWAIDEGEFAAPHAWIYAPPFRVLDVSIARQPHRPDALPHLPPYVLSESVKTRSVTPEDIMNPKMGAVLAARELRQLPASMGRYYKQFPPSVVNYGGLEMTYIPLNVGAPEAPLERITSISFSGKSGDQLYRSEILPRLRQLREKLNSGTG